MFLKLLWSVQKLNAFNANGKRKYETEKVVSSESQRNNQTFPLENKTRTWDRDAASDALICVSIAIQ